MRVAGIMHDSMKSGTDEDYAKNKYTKFEHPILAANNIRKMKGLSSSEIEVIATTIESHMGQWCTDRKSNTILPIPTNKYQKLVHLVDYLASRKDIEVLFDEEFQDKIDTPSPDEYILTFGKHNGKTLTEVAKCDPNWIAWAKENISREPVKSLLSQM